MLRLSLAHQRRKDKPKTHPAKAAFTAASASAALVASGRRSAPYRAARRRLKSHTMSSSEIPD